jgi:uncharacterized protein YcsI (UPF0317 family)
VDLRDASTLLERLVAIKTHHDIAQIHRAAAAAREGMLVAQIGWWSAPGPRGSMMPGSPPYNSAGGAMQPAVSSTGLPATTLGGLPPSALRDRIRAGDFRGQTAGLASGYVQANLVILPEDWAAEFAEFAAANRQACPVLATTHPGDPSVPELADGADLRTDLPAYRLYRDGRLAAEMPDILGLWRDDLVCFLIGCSFTFDHYLLSAGVTVRHVERACNVSMYRTSIPTTPTARLSGPLVVSMRPIPAAQVDLATRTSARYPEVHGGPVHVGDPSAIGIANLATPDYGDAVAAEEGDVPMFWACGVTPQAVAIASCVPFMITHAPGSMFVTDHRLTP